MEDSFIYRDERSGTSPSNYATSSRARSSTLSFRKPICILCCSPIPINFPNECSITESEAKLLVQHLNLNTTLSNYLDHFIQSKYCTLCRAEVKRLFELNRELSNKIDQVTGLVEDNFNRWLTEQEEYEREEATELDNYVLNLDDIEMTEIIDPSYPVSLNVVPDSPPRVNVKLENAVATPVPPKKKKKVGFLLPEQVFHIPHCDDDSYLNEPFVPFGPAGSGNSSEDSFIITAPTFSNRHHFPNPIIPKSIMKRPSPVPNAVHKSIFSRPEPQQLSPPIRTESPKPHVTYPAPTEIPKTHVSYPAPTESSNNLPNDQDELTLGSNTLTPIIKIKENLFDEESESLPPLRKHRSSVQPEPTQTKIRIISKDSYVNQKGEKVSTSTDHSTPLDTSENKKINPLSPTKSSIKSTNPIIRQGKAKKKRGWPLGKSRKFLSRKNSDTEKQDSTIKPFELLGLNNEIEDINLSPSKANAKALLTGDIPISPPRQLDLEVQAELSLLASEFGARRNSTGDSDTNGDSVMTKKRSRKQSFSPVKENNLTKEPEAGSEVPNLELEDKSEPSDTEKIVQQNQTENLLTKATEVEDLEFTELCNFLESKEGQDEVIPRRVGVIFGKQTNGFGSIALKSIFTLRLLEKMQKDEIAISLAADAIEHMTLDSDISEDPQVVLPLKDGNEQIAPTTAITENFNIDHKLDISSSSSLKTDTIGAEITAPTSPQSMNEINLSTSPSPNLKVSGTLTLKLGELMKLKKRRKKRKNGWQKGKIMKKKFLQTYTKAKLNIEQNVFQSSSLSKETSTSNVTTSENIEATGETPCSDSAQSIKPNKERKKKCITVTPIPILPKRIRKRPSRLLEVDEFFEPSTKRKPAIVTVEVVSPKNPNELSTESSILRKPSGDKPTSIKRGRGRPKKLLDSISNKVKVEFKLPVLLKPRRMSTGSIEVGNRSAEEDVPTNPVLTTLKPNLTGSRLNQSAPGALETVLNTSENQVIALDGVNLQGNVDGKLKSSGNENDLQNKEKKEVWSCEVQGCGRIFGGWKYLKDHEVDHLNPNEDSSRSRSENAAVLAQIFPKTPLQNFPCPICHNFPPASILFLKSHYRSVHPSAAQPAFCVPCNQSFLSYGVKRHHDLQCHKMKSTITNEEQQQFDVDIVPTFKQSISIPNIFEVEATPLEKLLTITSDTSAAKQIEKASSTPSLSNSSTTKEIGKIPVTVSDLSTTKGIEKAPATVSDHSTTKEIEKAPATVSDRSTTKEVEKTADNVSDRSTTKEIESAPATVSTTEVEKAPPLVLDTSTIKESKLPLKSAEQKDSSKNVDSDRLQKTSTEVKSPTKPAEKLITILRQSKISGISVSDGNGVNPIPGTSSKQGITLSSVSAAPQSLTKLTSASQIWAAAKSLLQLQNRSSSKTQGLTGNEEKLKEVQVSNEQRPVDQPKDNSDEPCTPELLENPSSTSEISTSSKKSNSNLAEPPAILEPKISESEVSSTTPICEPVESMQVAKSEQYLSSKLIGPTRISDTPLQNGVPKVVTSEPVSVISKPNVTSRSETSSLSTPFHKSLTSFSPIVPILAPPKKDPGLTTFAKHLGLAPIPTQKEKGKIQNTVMPLYPVPKLNSFVQAEAFRLRLNAYSKLLTSNKPEHSEIQNPAVSFVVEPSKLNSSNVARGDLLPANNRSVTAITITCAPTSKPGTVESTKLNANAGMVSSISNTIEHPKVNISCVPVQEKAKNTLIPENSKYFPSPSFSLFQELEVQKVARPPASNRPMPNLTKIDSAPRYRSVSPSPSPRTHFQQNSSQSVIMNAKQFPQVAHRRNSIETIPRGPHPDKKLVSTNSSPQFSIQKLPHLTQGPQVQAQTVSVIKPNRFFTASPQSQPYTLSNFRSTIASFEPPMSMTGPLPAKNYFKGVGSELTIEPVSGRAKVPNNHVNIQHINTTSQDINKNVSNYNQKPKL